jgi:transposase-like protein
MAHKRIVKEQAERLYIMEGKPINEIATILKVSQQTIYAWKKKHEWDKAIRASGTIGLTIEMTKSLFSEMNKAMKEGKLTDPKTADALAKISKIAEKLSPEKMMLSNIFNMLEDITHCIQNKIRDEDFLMLWGKYLREISDDLRRKYASGNNFRMSDE